MNQSISLILCPKNQKKGREEREIQWPPHYRDNLDNLDNLGFDVTDFREEEWHVYKIIGLSLWLKLGAHVNQ
jgi:hypothetical protein